MKIGIVTWFNVPNYGTFLQAFALQKFLQNKNYNVHLINFKTNFIYSDIRKVIFSVFPILRKINIYSNLKFIFDNCSYKYLKLSNRTTLKNSHKLNKEYDFFISGSDQIWSPANGSDRSFYMLDFYNGKNCISFGSSLGGNKIPDELKESYKNYLQKYKYISVRESCSKKTLENLLNKNIDNVCDPVFLLEKNQWQKYELKPKNFCKNQKKYIICYFLGFQSFYEEKLKQIKILFPDYEIKIIKLKNENVFKNIDFSSVEKSVSPFEFLYLLDKSEFVITDSFHATVFSLIFNKSFYHFLRFSEKDKTGQNSRVFELLAKTQTTKYLISSENDELPKINEFPKENIHLIEDFIEYSKTQLLTNLTFGEK